MGERKKRESFVLSFCEIRAIILQFQGVPVKEPEEDVYDSCMIGCGGGGSGGDQRACFMSCAFQTADHICIVCAGSLWAKKKKKIVPLRGLLRKLLMLRNEF